MRYGEADRIVTLYTKDRGRIGAIAKGVRRTKSKVGGRLEPFSLVRASLCTGRTLYTVVGVDTLRTFQGVRDEFFRMEEGGRLLIAVRRLFPGEEVNIPAFNLLVRSCARLAETHDAAMAAGVVLAARVKLLALLGYAPEVSHCASCGSDSGLHEFSPGLGGAVCEDCAVTREIGCFPLSERARCGLRMLLENTLADIERLDLDDQTAAEVEQVMAQILAYHGH